jgi:hypothetical protein
MNFVGTSTLVATGGARAIQVSSEAFQFLQDSGGV